VAKKYPVPRVPRNKPVRPINLFKQRGAGWTKPNGEQPKDRQRRRRSAPPDARRARPGHSFPNARDRANRRYAERRRKEKAKR
jgi:hypothetical protein